MIIRGSIKFEISFLFLSYIYLAVNDHEKEQQATSNNFLITITKKKSLLPHYYLSSIHLLISFVQCVHSYFNFKVKQASKYKSSSSSSNK